MTKIRLQAKRIKARFLPIALILLLLLFLLFSREVINGTRGALALCARVILPTLFPFMVLSELIGQSFSVSQAQKEKHTDLFFRLFGVSRAGMSAFLLGALCGFPLGIKHARTLYDHGQIDGGECARLVCFANNTGPAFAIAGVGALFGSFKTGLFLYLSQIVSALTVALIFAKLPAKEIHIKRKAQASHPFDVAGAIRKSAENALAVCGMVVFFSALSTLVSSFCQNSDLLLFIYPFLEVGGACGVASACRFLHPISALFAASFAISFGGVSVHMQAMLFFEGGHFPLFRYLLAKAIQGLLSCLLLLLFFSFL